MRRLGLILALGLGACSLTTPMPDTDMPIPATDAPLSWAQVTALKAPPAGQRDHYGPHAQQFGELRLPAGPGPHPVVVLIHGGCWLADFSLDYFAHWADWLQARGYASWNIEYRRLGDPGGGWPGTLQDVGAAIDHLRTLAQAHPLDLNRVTLAGHSAGGHLALWAGTRTRLPAESELAVSHAPLTAQRIIGLAPIVDLASYRIGPPGSCHAAVERLMGGPPEAWPVRYDEASPAQRLPLGVPGTLIIGQADTIVPPERVRQFRDEAQNQGDEISLIELPGAGHFDTGVPTAASAAAMLRALSTP